MPFAAAGLGALLQGDAFSLWRYQTADGRAAVEAEGYFAAALGTLHPGDLVLLHAADGVALLPVRAGPALGAGVTLDVVAAPLRAARGAAMSFVFTQTAAAVGRGLALAPVAAGIVVGGTVAVSAAATGPVAAVTFTLRDGTGQVVAPAQTVTVAGGAAAATFPAPPVGTAYRVRVEDAADATLAAVSNAFTVTLHPPALLHEAGDRLLLESGAALLR